MYGPNLEKLKIGAIHTKDAELLTNPLHTRGEKAHLPRVQKQGITTREPNARTENVSKPVQHNHLTLDLTFWQFWSKTPY